MSALYIAALIIAWFASGILGAAMWHWYTLDRLSRLWKPPSRDYVINSSHCAHLAMVTAFGPGGVLGVFIAMIISG